MNNDLESRIICANHLMRPKTQLMKREGYGDCTVCTPDPVNNPYCKGYIKVQLYQVEVKKDYNHG